jgi:serine/threonine protein phosphatase PrpC
MRFLPGNAQGIGTRAEQQDAFAFSDLEDAAFLTHGGALAVLADGMGGLRHGGQAAQTAVSAFLLTYESKQANEGVIMALDRALATANEAVHRLAWERQSEGELGTTLVAAVAQGGRLSWISVGDSRLYLYRAGVLYQLNQEHSYAEELDRQRAEGRISAAQARDHPDRRGVTSFLGLAAIPAVDRAAEPMPLQPGDRLVLCSDGVYGSLSEAELLAPLERDPQAAAETLVSTVLEKDNPDQDNCTVVILAGQDIKAKPRRGWGW